MYLIVCWDHYHALMTNTLSNTTREYNVPTHVCYITKDKIQSLICWCLPFRWWQKNMDEQESSTLFYQVCVFGGLSFVFAYFTCSHFSPCNLFGNFFVVEKFFFGPLPVITCDLNYVLMEVILDQPQTMLL